MSFVKIRNPSGSLNVLAILKLLFSARFGSLKMLSVKDVNPHRNPTTTGEDDEIEDGPLPGPGGPSHMFPSRRLPFEVDCDIDMKSPWLLDLLSDTPMVTEATATPPSPSYPVKTLLA